MSTKLFTNDPKNTLLEKFEGVFQYNDVHQFSTNSNCYFMQFGDEMNLNLRSEIYRRKLIIRYTNSLIEVRMK
jgi:hypothetical protein